MFPSRHTVFFPCTCSFQSRESSAQPTAGPPKAGLQEATCVLQGGLGSTAEVVRRRRWLKLQNKAAQRPNKGRQGHLSGERAIAEENLVTHVHKILRGLDPELKGMAGPPGPAEPSPGCPAAAGKGSSESASGSSRRRIQAVGWKLTRNRSAEPICRPAPELEPQLTENSVREPRCRGVRPTQVSAPLRGARRWPAPRHASDNPGSGWPAGEGEFAGCSSCLGIEA